MNINHPNDRNIYQQNPNYEQNPNYQQNPNFQPISNTPFDPNMLNNPQFLAMFQAFVNQNTQNLSPGTLHPTSQRVDPYPTTPGGDESSNRMRVANQFPTQSLDNDEDQARS